MSTSIPISPDDAAVRPLSERINQPNVAVAAKNDDDDDNNANAGAKAAPFRLSDADFANAALILRLGTFRRNAKKLYTFFQSQTLEWPSLSVAWLRRRKRLEGFRDFSLHQVVVGTQVPETKQQQQQQQQPQQEGEWQQAQPYNSNSASSQQLINYLSCIEFAIPFQIEDIDVLVREQEESSEVKERVPYRHVRGHSRLAQFVGVPDGAILRIVNTLEIYGGDSVAVKTSGSVDTLVYHLCDSERFMFSTDPRLNEPDFILRAWGTDARPGFGLASSQVETGLIASGGEDGSVAVYQLTDEQMEQCVDESRYAQRPDMVNLPKQQRRGPATSIRARRLLEPASGHAVNDVSCHGSQGHLIVSAHSNGDAILWDLRVKGGAASGENLPRHRDGCNSAQFHPSAAFQVATAGEDCCVRLWDLRNWKANSIASFSYHTQPVQRVAWAPFSDSVFASCGDDGIVCLWDLSRGVEAANDTGEVGVPKELAFVHCGHVSPVIDVAWCPNVNDEWTVASVDHSNLLQVWRPNPSSVSANLKADAFDIDELEENAN